MHITTKQSPAETIRQWVIALGVLTSDGRLTADDAELKLKAYVPLLLEHFPHAAFTQASLHHVAAQCKWFPSYAEVVTHLRAWWRDNRPIHNALPAPMHQHDEPVRQPPTDNEREYVRQRVNEITARLACNTDDPLPKQNPGPKHLTPAQLDRVSPLPNSKKRA